MPDDEKPQSTAGGATKFEDLQGLLKGAWIPSAAQAFLRRERDGFYDRDTGEEE